MTLSPPERAQFRHALREFIEDLETRQFRPSLRVKGIRGAPGVFEMTWEYHNGRATFQFGDTSKGWNHSRSTGRSVRQDVVHGTNLTDRAFELQHQQGPGNGR